MAVIFVAWYSSYDTLLLRLSPRDFHMTMWR
jgi:hypothetical protein